MLSFTFPKRSLIKLQIPSFHRDQNSKGDGKLIYVKQGIMAKRLENLENKLSETICIEITISKKKLYALFAYRPAK